MEIFDAGTHCKLSPECRLARGNIQWLGILYLISKSEYFNPDVIEDLIVRPKWVFLLEKRIGVEYPDLCVSLDPLAEVPVRSSVVTILKCA